VRARTAMKQSALLGLLCVLAGCEVFDESLLDAGPGGDAGPPPVDLAENCLSGDPPTLDSFNQFLDVDTTSLDNDFFSLSSCLGTNAPGRDGFFRVEMLAGQKWHFHVQLQGTPEDPATIDPAVYVLDNACDERTCGRGDGLNECGPGQDEHFSFVATASGDYFVGIDAVNPEGDAMKVLGVRPLCGDGTKEHSETCDSDADVPGRTCTDACRAQISEATPFPREETEPNDEPLANANLVLLPGGTGPLSVSGQLGGSCNFDSFGMEVAAGGTVTATMTGDACADYAMRAIVRTPDGLTQLGDEVETASGTCPTITSDPVPEAGTYYVRFTTQSTTEPTALDYALELSVTP